MKFTLLTFFVLLPSIAFANEGLPIICFQKTDQFFIKGFLSNNYARSDFAIYNLDTLQSVYKVPTHVEILSHSSLILDFSSKEQNQLSDYFRGQASHMRVFLQSSDNLGLYEAVRQRQRVKAQFHFRNDPYFGDYQVNNAYCKLEVF